MDYLRKVRSRGFTTVTNDIFFEKTLSLKAKGLYCLMQSLADGWRFSIAGLAGTSSDGKAAVRSAVHELERAGYLRREVVRVSGKIAGSNYYLMDEPIPPETPEERIREMLAPSEPTPYAAMLDAVATPDEDDSVPNPQVDSIVHFSDNGEEAETAQVNSIVRFSSVCKSNGINKKRIKESPLPPVPLKTNGEVESHPEPIGMEEEDSDLHGESSDRMGEAGRERHHTAPRPHNENEWAARTAGLPRLDADGMTWFNRCMRVAVNSRRRSEALSAFTRLVGEGYGAKELYDAWKAYLDALKAQGREERYFPNLHSWLTRDTVDGAVYQIQSRAYLESNSTDNRGIEGDGRPDRQKPRDETRRVSYRIGKSGSRSAVIAIDASGSHILAGADPAGAPEEWELAYQRAIGANR